MTRREQVEKAAAERERLDGEGSAPARREQAPAKREQAAAERGEERREAAELQRETDRAEEAARASGA